MIVDKTDHGVSSIENAGINDSDKLHDEQIKRTPYGVGSRKHAR